MLVKPFEDQARTQPGQIAVKTVEEALTYEELEKRANRLAHFINREAARLNRNLQTVALLFNHDISMIIGILAVLKAGRCYVPLSPGYPYWRLAFMISNSESLIILTESCHQEIAGKLALENKILYLNIHNCEIDACPDDPPPRETNGHQNAYILYTSGSTGRPRGVRQTQENVLYYTRNWTQRFLISCEDKMTLFSSFCHDGSVQDMFGALHNGAALYLVDVKNRQYTVELSEYLVKEKITIWHSVPSLYSYFVNSLTGKERFPHLRFILLGGEALRENEIIMLKKYFPHCTLANVYGQTESSVNSIWLVHPGDPFDKMIIGEPLDNTGILLMDEKGNEADPLDIGEIIINCPHLSPGYWKDEAATRQSFRRHPDYGLLYRTGDLGRLLLDGSIEFIGRKDTQVKIRGYRVELGEIESRLLEHDKIREAAVCVHQDKKGDIHLCAYIVARNEAKSPGTPNTTELREYLAQYLPDYMIPAYFMSMERLPLTGSGKTNRKALPEPKVEIQSSYTAPRNPIEKKLVEMWSEILAIEKERIGTNMNFFELGGQSLKAITLVLKIHKALEVRLPLVNVFKTPTIKILAERIRGLTKDKYASIEPTEEKEYYPLSSSQKRLYILQQMETQSIGYNMPMLFHLEENIDNRKLEVVFKKLISHQESLRTSFEMIAEEPVQRVHKNAAFEIEYYDLQVTGPGERCRWEDEGNFIRPFDLSRAPLLRVGIIKLKGKNHILAIDKHHIITDGTSQAILKKEFVTVYGRKELQPLRIRYKDYAQWLKSETEKNWVKSQQVYWLDEFKEEVQPLNLPYDYSRPVVQSFEGGAIGFDLGKKETGHLKELAANQGATLFMVLLAMFNVLLSKLGRQEDILVGTPIAGRRHAELESIVGMFVNTLALRNYPASEMGFNDFLKNVKERTLQAFENQDYPFEDLVDRVCVSRDMGRNPLFDVVFVLQNIDVQYDDTRESGISRLKLEPYKHEVKTSKFDMSFTGIEANGKLFFKVEYCTKLFKKETIQRFITYFKQVLFSVIDNPFQQIWQIENLPGEEKNQLLYDFNNTEAEYPQDKTLQQLFAEQVERTPDNIALVGEEEEWKGRRVEDEGESFGKISNARGEMISITYNDLNEISDQLAYLLMEKGVKPDIIVGIMVGRSVKMIIGILGILKVGGAYMPIDPGYPQERIDYMLTDSNAKILVTTGSLMEEKKLGREGDRKIGNWEANTIFAFGNFPPQRGASSLYFKSTGGGGVCPILQPVTNPSNLAYIIYTSGTTGRPKGVMIQQQNVVRLLFNRQFQFDFNETDAWTLFHSFCFDFSVWEMYGALLYGGKLVIIPKMTAIDLGEFLEILKKYNVTVLNQTPSAFYNLINLESAQPGKPLRLKYVIFGGEALTPGKLNAWRSRYPGTRLVNMYGITETTIHVTYKEIGQQEITTNISNIGTPIPTLFTYAMAKHLKLSPRGVAGELCIGGQGLGRGYLNRPQLTHEKFVQNPYKPGERLYLSGDLVRLLENGEMEYLGRIDQQVQIRGFRIEPGEIEYRLLTHPQIKEAVVLTRQDEKEDNYLCAYIVSTDPAGKIPGAFQLRDHLAKNLPDYMIPAFFTQIEAIPLTANGKIDKKALPKPEVIPGAVYIAPGDMIEERLTEIWADILDLDKNVVSMDADFFELGGHSLKATILIGRIHKELDIKIPLVNIFKTPTIRGLAHIIKNTSLEKYLSIPAVEKRDYYALSSAQKRLYILQQMDPSNTSYNLPMVVSLEGNVDENRFKKTVRKLIQRHESLRTSFEMIHEQPVQKIHDDVEFEIQYYDLATEETEKKNYNALVQKKGRGRMTNYKQIPNYKSQIINKKETGSHHSSFIIHHFFVRPFDLSRAPLLRVGLIKEKEQKYLLMVNMHHIITDGTSSGIFAREFMALYGGVNLPGIPIQYKDFSGWQDKIFAAGFTKAQQDYWQREFQGEIPVLELPYDFEKPVVMSFEGDTLGFEIDSGETQRLKEISRKENTTLFMTLLAILYVFLAKISSQEDIVMGTPIAGRRHADLQRLIGVFINTLALRNYPNPEKSFKNFLQEVKNRTLKSYENQEYPFEDLVEKVVLIRDTGRNPLFDVMVVFQNIDVRLTDIPEIETPGLKLKPYRYKTGRSKFDMNFTAMEREDRLFLRFEYCTKLFREATIERFINYIKKITHDIIINPGIRLGQIEILSEEEKQGILFEFNETETQYPWDKSIHQLFDEQVEITPDHIAVVGQGWRRALGAVGCTITYRELNRKSNQLAHLLRQQGVKPNSILGIMGHPSLEMVIWILGILKSGGAYLPLDPGYPRERIRFMLEDSSVRWLITRKAFVEAVGDQYEYEIIDPEDPGLFKGEGENLTIVNYPGDLAYVIYTSGSTGKPKGVMIQQQSLVNYMCWGKNQYIDGDHYIFPLYTTISFDLTVTSVFLPLLSGNRIVIYQGEENLLPIREIAGDGFVDIVKLTPSHLRIFPGNMNERSHSIKTFIVGGEQLESSLARDIQQRFHGNLRLYNEYGPTEATVGCMIYKYDYEPHQKGSVPIGIPIDNARIYILDEYLHSVPFNVIGGIYIGGDTLARGYLDRPELTAEKFLKNPFVPGESIYKTGDLARRLPNGNIEFLGRMDEQVKIRGFRIEPGEIENRLLTHEHIKEVVVVKENTGADFYLSAYIVPNSPGFSSSFKVSALREYLLGELPEYMLPSRFIQLDHIPLTSNGKVDKKALALLGTRLGTGVEYVAPQNEVEKKIAGIWQDILELDKISINDNFFELGGTSLKLIRVNTRLKEKFSRDIPVVDLFRYPTIRLLTRYLNQKVDGYELTGNQRVEEINKGKYKMKNLKKKMRAMENG